ncbi:MAG: 3-hydroxylacyl-ACP dehydratase [Treponema sp.]|nr:3-hydroxylacyl-ACP dehydratase [Treponema sp.]MBD5406157.1 3-hydroxylacyl-ACP dehydratase [Treponema sp.]MBD5411102.1 3-hydroxylacyl-ACP dehydratase [Treponema sp.]
MAIEPKNVAQYIERDELIEYLPHKGKMFLLSRVTQHDVHKHTITSEYDITKDCIFYEEEFDGIPTWAGFELMAQGISALTGITNKIKGREPLPGMILSVVDFKASVGFLKNNTTCQMKIAEDYRDEETNTYCYLCSLYACVGAESPVATAKITVMETESMSGMFSEA